MRSIAHRSAAALKIVTRSHAIRQCSSSNSQEQSTMMTPGAVVCGVALVATAAGGFRFIFDWPEPCEMALNKARNQTEAQALLGSPIKRELWWEGHMTPKTAQVRLKVYGPKASATLVGNVVHVPLTLGDAPSWQLLLLELHHLDEENRLKTINLLEDLGVEKPDPAALQALANAMHPGAAWSTDGALAPPTEQGAKRVLQSASNQK